MKVSSKRATMVVTRSFEITEDHPVVDMAHSLASKKVRVYSGGIKYSWADGAWVVLSGYGINLHCVVLKKDGTDSANTHTRNPGSQRMPYGQLWEPTADFAWLLPIVKLLRPRGGPSMTSLNEHEVSA